METLKLGSKARCKVTGFKGILVTRVEYLNGCVRYALQPKVDKDGKHPGDLYVDEEQVEVIGRGVVEQLGEAIPTGGPRDAPPQRPTP